MLEEVSLLPEGLGACVALERLLPRVRPEVDLDVGLVQEAPVANVAPVHGLLLPGAVRRHHRRHLGLGGPVLVLGPTPAAAAASVPSAVRVGRHPAHAHRVVEIAQIFTIAALDGRGTTGRRRDVAPARVATRGVVLARQGGAHLTGMLERGVRQLESFLGGGGRGAGHGARVEIALLAVVVVLRSAGRESSLEERHVHGGLALDRAPAGAGRIVLTHVGEGYAPRRRGPLTQERLESGTHAATAVVLLLLLGLL